MRLLWLTIVTACCFCAAHAVLSGKEAKRQAGFDRYGPPPRPAPQYGPPPPQQQQHIPHREYGVPQQIPFREYGPPALKYGPPKLNFLGGGSSSSSSSSSGSLHEQVKTHFGVPVPFYGPPHIQKKPGPQYGPPPPPSPVYGPPQAQYGPPPPQPSPQYGPPPSPQYGPPKQRYGPPPPPPSKIQFGGPQPLPAPHPAPLFKPAHQPATSYGPPASGPLNLPPKPVYEPPPNYGPPPLPISLPGPQSPNFHSVPQPSGGPLQQVRIQIDASGHTHSVSGSQVPFHTACDGWKPIPAPVGANIEQHHIESQGYSGANINQGHSQVNTQGQQIVTQYNLGGAGATGGSSSIVDGLTDEQLVAVALQGDVNNVITGPSGGDAHLNSIDSDALQITVENSKPTEIFAAGGPNYQPTGNGPIPGPQYGPPPPAPPPQFAAQTSSHAQSSSQSHAHSHSHSQSNVNIQYGPPSDNLLPLPQYNVGPPNKPVAYRPPVPAGLLESIGATVQHLDQFGVKPPQQSPNYIPPATNEIALSGPSGPPPAPQALYGAPINQLPPPPQQIISQQQLPQAQPGQVFGPPKLIAVQPYNPAARPPPPPNGHFAQGLLQPPAIQQQYLPPPPIFVQQQQHQQQQHQQQQQHHAENSYSASQYTQQYINSQGLPLAQQSQRFDLDPRQNTLHLQPPVTVHNCGHGPNLVSSTGYAVQQQQQQQQHQQQQQFGSISTASNVGYNAIAQSIPLVEQHTEFLSGGPSDSYGPPPSGNDIDFDHSGYASQKSAVAALPDGTDPNQLPGLNGLDVISAQKSQSIQLNAGAEKSAQNFEIQFGTSLNNAAGSGNGNANIANPTNLDEHGVNHEEILSQGLLQSILTAIEQPQSSSAGPQNHRAQSRSDEPLDDADEDKDLHHHDSKHDELHDENDEELHAKVKEIEPIVAADVQEEAKN
ncbi:trithorax group protein osa [Drosophila sulfurigaster albostrigata]|uniref:trithorax group protein osa n=1 Tax=Drosophila sulfurigaster albostrigata TaxID=89887 RepID=UPI002D21DEC1|nr:trithorax group protein osa [Drosophila sulfurigaster albostrigata]